MMYKHSFKRLIYTIGLFALALAGCNRTEPFDRKAWKDGDGLDYHRRYKMLDDLLKNHKLKGLTYKEAVNLLYYPQRRGLDKRYFSYEITVKFNGSDTTYVKSLVLYLNPDSVVTGYGIYEKKFDLKKKKK